MAGLVVILDDEPDFCHLLSGICRKRGLPTECVHTLAGAIALKGTAPALLFLDNNLPDGLGIRNVKFLRDHLPATKVVFVTADSSPTISQEAFAAGADYFLAKPVKLSHVEQILSEVGVYDGP